MLRTDGINICIASLVIVIVTGCSSPPSTPEVATSESALPTATADVPTPSLDTVIPGGTPFSAYFPGLDSLVAERQKNTEARRSRHDSTEALVASCMKDAGFGPVGGRRGNQPWPHAPDGKPRPVNMDNAPSLEQMVEVG